MYILVSNHSPPQGCLQTQEAMRPAMGLHPHLLPVQWVAAWNTLGKTRAAWTTRLHRTQGTTALLSGRGSSQAPGFGFGPGLLGDLSAWTQGCELCSTPVQPKHKSAIGTKRFSLFSGVSAQVQTFTPACFLSSQWLECTAGSGLEAAAPDSRLDVSQPHGEREGRRQEVSQLLLGGRRGPRSR